MTYMGCILSHSCYEFGNSYYIIRKQLDNRVMNEKLLEIIQTLQICNEKLAERIYTVENDNHNLTAGYENLQNGTQKFSEKFHTV